MLLYINNFSKRNAKTVHNYIKNKTRFLTKFKENTKIKNDLSENIDYEALNFKLMKEKKADYLRKM